MGVRLSTLIAASAMSLMIAPVWAHIGLIEGGTHVAKYQPGARGAFTKTPPCGNNPDSAPTGAIYTYKPGETITVKVSEYVPHPGYMRVAFDKDGESGFMEPRWIVPIDPQKRKGGCPINAEDQCRAGDYLTDGDFFNNSTVLQDNLMPSAGDTGKRMHTLEIKLPDVECDNCTLQIIQVMEDHGVYNTANGENNDVYHQCIAIRLTPKAVSGQPANAAATTLMKDMLKEETSSKP